MPIPCGGCLVWGCRREALNLMHLQHCEVFVERPAAEPALRQTAHVGVNNLVKYLCADKCAGQNGLSTGKGFYHWESASMPIPAKYQAIE